MKGFGELLGEERVRILEQVGKGVLEGRVMLLAGVVCV